MRWVTRVSGGRFFVLDTFDWLEHEYTTSSALKLEGLLGVDKGTVFPCFNLYRRYYGLHNLVIEGTHLNLQFTPTDVTLVTVKDKFEGKTLMIPPLVTQFKERVFSHLSIGKLDMPYFDTSNETDMACMFEGCWIKDMNVSHFDTSRVTDMCHMFQDCRVKELDLSCFDTSKVTDMKGMFYYCSAKNIDVSHFDTSQVTDMSFMFSDCQAKELDVSRFDTGSVMDMCYMFSGCSAKELNVSHFDTSRVKDLSHMFQNYYGVVIGRERFPKEAFE